MASAQDPFNDAQRLAEAMKWVDVPPEADAPVGLLGWMRARQRESSETLAMVQMLAERLAPLLAVHPEETVEGVLNDMRKRYQHILYSNLGIDPGATRARDSAWWQGDPEAPPGSPAYEGDDF